MNPRNLTTEAAKITAMKTIAIAAAILMVSSTGAAFAGVTPNTAASAAARSGAKIAPAKNTAPSQQQDASDAQSGTAK